MPRSLVRSSVQVAMTRRSKKSLPGAQVDAQPGAEGFPTDLLQRLMLRPPVQSFLPARRRKPNFIITNLNCPFCYDDIREDDGDGRRSDEHPA